MIVLGGIFILWGWVALFIYGKGLPMNAFPPKLFVTRGPFRIFTHPIYCGFAILLVGIFIMTGSSSGIWLVLPVTILGMIAMVLGFEKIDLQERFPADKVVSFFSLP